LHLSISFRPDSRSRQLKNCRLLSVKNVSRTIWPSGNSSAS
jgi:hypothetical protein